MKNNAFVGLNASRENLLFQLIHFWIRPAVMRTPLNLNKGQISNRANNAKLKIFKKMVAFTE